MKAKKSYGQHFLREDSIAERIALSLEQKGEYKKILEVGPGMGMLTQFLLKHYDTSHEISVVEADADMVAELQKRFKANDLKIVFKNFLDFDIQREIGESFGLIGNYPYNISSQILFKQLEYKELIPEMVGMFQKEVALRVVAKPKTKDYGILSLLVQAYYETEYLFSVAPESFDPPPKVQSAVIRLKRKENQELGCNEQLFKKIVKATFGQRRKMLRNGLKPFMDKEMLFSEPFFQKRPEELSLQDFIDLTNRVESEGNK